MNNLRQKQWRASLCQGWLRASLFMRHCLPRRQLAFV
jgi:hypothetical protein